MLSNNYNILEERYLEIKNTIEYKYSDPRMVVNNKGRIKERWLEYRIGNSLVDKDDLPEGYENFNLRLDFLGAVKKNGFNIIEGDLWIEKSNLDTYKKITYDQFLLDKKTFWARQQALYELMILDEKNASYNLVNQFIDDSTLKEITHDIKKIENIIKVLDETLFGFDFLLSSNKSRKRSIIDIDKEVKERTKLMMEDHYKITKPLSIRKSENEMNWFNKILDGFKKEYNNHENEDIKEIFIDNSKMYAKLYEFYSEICETYTFNLSYLENTHYRISINENYSDYIKENQNYLMVFDDYHSKCMDTISSSENFLSSIFVYLKACGYFLKDLNILDTELIKPISVIGVEEMKKIYKSKSNES